MPIIISFAALIVSIYSRIRSHKYHRQNFIREKVERMISIMEDLGIEYAELLSVTHDLDIYYDVAGTKRLSAADIAHERYLEEKKKLLEKIEVPKIKSKQRELEILARTYLKTDLKRRVISVSWLFRDVIRYGVGQEQMLKEKLWKEGFPDILKVQKYIDDAQNRLIEQNGFVKDEMHFRKNTRQYIDNHFKKDVGLLERSRQKTDD